MTRRIAIVTALSAALLVVAGAPAGAHPLGNFTVNTYAGVVVAAHEASVDYVVDMAEIPAFEARQRIDADGNGISAAEENAYAAASCSRIAAELSLRINAVAARFAPTAHRISFPPGTGALQTLRLECDLRAPAHAATGATIEFADRTFAGRLGWHEVTVRGDGVALASDAPAESASARLTAYPNDVLRSPLDVREANARVTDVQATASTIAQDPDRPEPSKRPGSTLDRLSRTLVGFASEQRLTPGFLMLAMIVAIGLGALHAAAPGHGKTIIAAAVVSSGTGLRQAFTLGAAAAVAHTASVAVIGIAVAAFGVTAPERAFPWLTLAGGFVAIGVGSSLAIRWLESRRTALVHAHDHGPHDGSRRTLVWLGLTGGLVPSPSALLVLLAAIGLGRAWLGALLVVCYGIGTAITLAAIALVVARAGTRVERRGARPGMLARLTSFVRPAGALGVVVAGALLVARGAVAI